jgi:hypothetical protein
MPLQVKLSICKNDGQGEQETANDPRMSKSLANLDLDEADDDTQLYNMSVESSGKYTRKATWEDLHRYTGLEVTPDMLVDWIVNYQTKCFPEGKLASFKLRVNDKNQLELLSCPFHARVLILPFSRCCLRLGKTLSYSQEVLH